MVTYHLVLHGKLTKILSTGTQREHTYHKYVLNRSQIEGYTRLLFFRKFSILPTVMCAYLFNNFQENFQPLCFFIYTNEKFSILPVVIRAYLLVNFKEQFQPTLLLEPPLKSNPLLQNFVNTLYIIVS